MPITKQIKPKCTCNYAELIDPKKYNFPKSTVIHSRKCECFWFNYTEAKLLKVDEFHTT